MLDGESGGQKRPMIFTALSSAGITFEPHPRITYIYVKGFIHRFYSIHLNQKWKRKNRENERSEPATGGRCFVDQIGRSGGCRAGA